MTDYRRRRFAAFWLFAGTALELLFSLLKGAIAVLALVTVGVVFGVLMAIVYTFTLRTASTPKTSST
ncbi:hypothetical protein [Mongoliimonas terrestris]|uniref:hypothetical protein n=1 Tax=Mongoliimonas terrestris TaxID=1709001 RepID=UPI000AC95A3A|nr:hypothetical protein [Mongoliimonas terrestris]